MKDFIRDRLRLLLEHKKTTHTGVSKPDYGGGGDRVYYFNHGTLEDFKNDVDSIIIPSCIVLLYLFFFIQKRKINSIMSFFKSVR